MAIKDRCQAMRDQGRVVYDFGLGQSPFPVPDSVVEALRRSAAEKEYLPVTGLPALREAVADFHRERDQINTDADGVIVGPGSKELMFLLQLAFYGEIVIPTPCWVSYLPQANMIGRRVNLLHTSYERGWRMTADHLDEALEIAKDRHCPRLLVLNYPSNPSGLTYTAEALQAIAEVARRFELVVLSDEIYGQLHHKGRHVSIARYYPEGTIVSSGLSKWCGAGGWRLGTFCFPPELYWLRDALAAAASETFTSVCTPIQHASVQAFRGGPDLECYLLQVRRILEALGGRCWKTLVDAGFRVHAPAGGFYLFLDFSPFRQRLAEVGIYNANVLCDRLMEEQGVALLSGVSFNRSPKELTARLAYVDFNGRRALAAGDRVPFHEALPTDFLDRHCGHVLEGIRRMVGWLNELPGRAPAEPAVREPCHA